MRRLIPLLLLATAAACGGIIASAPPATEPVASREFHMLGAPTVAAAKAARSLNEFGFATKRFGADSTWGTRLQDSLWVRLRYSMPSRDSSRVLIEMWGRCSAGARQRRLCLEGEMQSIMARMAADEAPPG